MSARIATADKVERAFDVERDLQLAIAAIERQDFAVADERLHRVELRAPALAEAWYHRALLNWWLSRDTDGPAIRALTGKLSGLALAGTGYVAIHLALR